MSTFQCDELIATFIKRVSESELKTLRRGGRLTGVQLRDAARWKVRKERKWSSGSESGTGVPA